MSSGVKSFVLAALLLALALFIGQPVLAQTDDLAAVAGNTSFGGADIITIVGNVIKVILGLLGIIFLVIVIYSGFLWMTAGGDAKQVERAKKLLINAVIGIVIILFSYAITSFIINAFLDATGADNADGPNGSVTIPAFSGSLGAGAVQDHYPYRDQTDVARNTNITVTFREQMLIESFIEGYDDNGTPLDVSDDVTATTINTDNVQIYRSADGDEAALTNIDVFFTDDLRTFVFNPVDYLGSATEDVSYTVFLDPDIQDASGNDVFVGSNNGGYEWTFITGVNLDLDPPEVVSVTPVAGGSYAKNIIVQVTFNEPMDPTSAAGVREEGSGFSNIQVAGAGGVPTAGTYIISNGYKTVTFESSADCGTNSCGETIFCLPGGQAITSTISAATLSSSPPQSNFPYDGVVDMAANSLDGNGDGTAGDDYTWGFTTTDDIYLLGSSIETISPDISAESVALDQDITMVFSDILMSSTVTSDNISLTNKEVTGGDSHEQWYRFDVDSLTADGLEVENDTMVPAKTLVTMPHGVLLESVDGKTYMYGVNVTEGIRNQYQNCYLPAQGPDAAGGMCGVTAENPYCCNGQPQSTACTLF